MGNIITVNFRGDKLCAIREDDGDFVPLKPIVEYMGLNWSGQYLRVKRDTVLSEGVCIMHIPFGSKGNEDMVCLRLDLLNGWLFTIDDSRIKDDAVRQKVLLYKRECYKVLYEHFQGKKSASPGDDFDFDSMEPTKQDAHKVKLQTVSQTRHAFGDQAARQIWFKLGLPTVPAMYHTPHQAQLFDYQVAVSG